MSTWLVIFYSVMVVTIIVYAYMEKDKAERDELLKRTDKKEQKKRRQVQH